MTRGKVQASSNRFHQNTLNSLQLATAVVCGTAVLAILAHPCESTGSQHALPFLFAFAALTGLCDGPDCCFLLGHCGDMRTPSTDSSLAIQAQQAALSTYLKGWLSAGR